MTGFHRLVAGTLRALANTIIVQSNPKVEEFRRILKRQLETQKLNDGNISPAPAPTKLWVFDSIVEMRLPVSISGQQPAA
jgi:hypothetical protein